jgi:hypothetical protein
MVEAVIAPLRGDKQREQEPTNDAVPVAGRDRILVLALSTFSIPRLRFVFCSPTLAFVVEPFFVPNNF